MNRKSFRSCAEHYLTQWCEQDRQFVQSFARGRVSCELLGRMCVKYEVARTVPGHGVEKYAKFAGILNSHRKTVFTRENTPEIIETARRNLERAYKANFLSAISKAFWMMKRHPVVRQAGSKGFAPERPSIW